jgi:hypothetical protein
MWNHPLKVALEIRRHLHRDGKIWGWGGVSFQAAFKDKVVLELSKTHRMVFSHSADSEVSKMDSHRAAFNHKVVSEVSRTDSRTKALQEDFNNKAHISRSRSNHRSNLPVATLDFLLRRAKLLLPHRYRNLLLLGASRRLR